MGPAGANGAARATGAAGLDGTNGSPGAVGPGAGVLAVNNAALASMAQANSVTLEVTLDGASQVLRMFTPATAPNAVGTFVGGGTGNKGIVGLSGFNGMKLTDLGGLEFDFKLVQGPANNFYMNFIVDLDCNADEALSAPTAGALAAR